MSRADAGLPEHAPVAVTWLDAAFDLDKEAELMPMTTMGYLIRQDDDVLVIASEADLPAKYFRAFTTIPAGWVQHVELLKPAF